MPKNLNESKKILTIAGSDILSGGGMQADLATFAANGLYGFCALTSIVTVKEDKFFVHPVEKELFQEELESLSDVDFSAIKIGLLPNKEILELTKNWLTALSVKSDTPIILDPVIVFKENADYSVNEMRDLFISQLFPLATVITPNLKEAEILTGLSVKSKSEMKEAAKLLHDFGAKNVVIKGGNRFDQKQAIDLAYDAEAKEVTAPTFRHDLFRLADLAEEVARFYGYDNIPTTLPKGEATTGKLSFKLRIEEAARNIAEFCGFSQGMTYSFESPKVFDKLLIPADSELRRTVEILNPLGEDYSIMRTTSLNGMLTSLATNYNRRNKDVRLYELGNIYLPKQVPVTELPEERMQFTLGMYGEGDFFSMKGVVEEFFEKIGMKERETYDPNAGKSFLHPGRQANIIYNGRVVGYLGEVHPEVADTYGIGTKAYVAVIDMPEVVELATFDRKYEGIAKYPAVTRDISMVVPKKILVGQIEEVIGKKGGAYLESYKLFDIYEGAQIKAGFKSVAYSIVFRAKDKTLEEADISSAMKKILSALEEMGIELRQ